MSRRRIPIFFILSIALMLFAVGFIAALLSNLSREQAAAPAVTPLETSTGPLPDLGGVPSFSLVAETGEPFGKGELDGGPWLADFIFTTCAGVCPIMSTQMALLQNELPEESLLHLVSISVDPGHDTPEVLREYASRYGARPERWVFLTGEPAAVYELSMKGFKLAAGEKDEYVPGVDDGPFIHSTRMALVDSAGRIRGYYDGTDAEEMARLRKDLGRLDAGS